MEKNYHKYFSYRYAFGRINDAIAAGFYLEAITIEESIISDRLLRVCRNFGYKEALHNASLGSLEKYLEKNIARIQEIMPETCSVFLPRIKEFRGYRNKCLHQIAKSEPGEKTLEVEEFLEITKKIALDGKLLARDLSNWVKEYKRATKPVIVQE